MTRRSYAAAGITVALGVTLAAAGNQAARPAVGVPAKPINRIAQAAPSSAAPKPAPKPMAVAHAAAGLPVAAQNALIDTYCVNCHNDNRKSGGQSFEHFDAATVTEHAEVAEKMIRKLRAGMMPPPKSKRPDAETMGRFIAALETRIDRAAALRPNPGHRVFQRLNRIEYARAVKDLLDLDVDVEAFLPPDTLSHGFDNVADVQGFSPTLTEGYLRAASRISTLAVGDRTASPSEATYKVPRTASQTRRVEGAPFGTRGGISVVHTFPADGEYVFRVMLHSIPTGQLFGSTVKGEQLEVSIDGRRMAVLDINPRMSESDPNGMNIQTPPVAVKAGPQRVTAAFIQRFEAPVDDLIVPQEYTLADTQIGSGYGVTTLPHVRDLAISGPRRVTGVSDTPSRRRIFICRPTAPDEEVPCARQILLNLTRQAYREPSSSGDIEALMKFYDQGRKGGDFESGIRMATQALLASPRFLFRLEPAPAALRPGQTYRIGDGELASRLSFFLWGTGPDAALLKAAGAGTLHTPPVLGRHVRRMLADPRAEALGPRFAAQWLRLQDLDKIRPDALLYPMYDTRIAEALKRETELFFYHLVKDDRSALELLTADYTYANDLVAKHYGIPNVAGSTFRKVALPEYRRGLLGQGSILTLTSVADRTSPVLRGKWVMEVLLGTPPPPPPPNVPALDDSVKANAGGRMLSTRERMEEHRKNPACNSCHRVIDPLGLALDHFDVTGAYRIKDNEVPVDTEGELYDGTKIDGVQGLREAILRHQDVFLQSFTESLMTYALGRRVEYFDMPAVRRIVSDAAKNGNRMSSFFLGVVRSAAFQMAKVEPARTVTTDAAAERPEPRSR